MTMKKQQAASSVRVYLNDRCADVLTPISDIVDGDCDCTVLDSCSPFRDCTCSTDDCWNCVQVSVLSHCGVIEIENQLRPGRPRKK
jgi:hypothetical protein